MAEPDCAAGLYLVTRHGTHAYGGGSAGVPQVPVRAYPSLAAAEAFVRQEVARLLRTCNPFRQAEPDTWGEWAGDTIRVRTEVLAAWVGAGVPTAALAGRALKSGEILSVVANWWEVVLPSLADEQVRRVWAACDDFRFFEIVEMPWEDAS